MKKLIVVLFLLLNFQFILAQMIQGKVETENGTALSGVNIYIDGSSLHTESKIDGSFELDSKGQKSGTIVFQKSGYETNSVPLGTVLGKSVKVQLLRFQEIEELVMIPFTEEAYRNYITYFLQQFLGYDLENIKIKNQRTLKFSYDKKNKILKVKAPQTLLIENKKLGYEIKYNLMNFESDFNSKIMSFYGTSFFKETSSKPQIKVNRMNAFIGSVPHFFRNVYQNTTEKEGYIVNYIVRQKNPKYPSDKELQQLKEHLSFVSKTGTLNLPEEIKAISNRKMKESEYVLLLTKSKLPISEYTKLKEENRVLTIDDLLQVNYTKYPYELTKGKIVKSQLPTQQSSMIYVNGAIFQIYPDGNISNVEEFLVDGSFSENKLSSMLPSDYQLGD